MTEEDIGKRPTDPAPPDVMGALADILEQLREVKSICQGLANDAMERNKRLQDVEATVSDMRIEFDELKRTLRHHRTDAE